MNTDDFESQLARQSLRSVPPEWRDELLARAQASVPKPAPAPKLDWFTAWRLLLGRIPAAWGALALLWVVIFSLNGLLSDTAAPHAPVPAPMEPLTAWNLQRAELGQLADLAPAKSEPPRHPVAPATAPSPRTERRRDETLGELGSGESFITIV